MQQNMTIVNHAVITRKP